MKKITLLSSLISLCIVAVSQNGQSIDAYVNSPGDNVFDVVVNGSNGVNRPNDLDFNRAQTNGTPELWVINEGTENSGGSTVTVSNPGESNQQSVLLRDGNAWHFMSLPTAMAFGDDGNWANSPGVFSANHNGSPFTGPSLWSGKFGIYAVTPPGGNGSHLDMLHQSPNAMGIAHEKDNIYWVNDGYNSTIVMYDFAVDHGPGNSWHDDGRVHFYSEISVKRDVTGVPGHMILDKKTDWLYIADTGNNRIIRMKVGSATKKLNLPFNMEALAERWEMENVTWEVVVSNNLSKPCGIDVYGDRLVVSNNGTKEFIIYDLSQSPISEVGRIAAPKSNANLRGLVIDNHGQMWFTDYVNNEVYRLKNNKVVGVEERENELSFSLYPNPSDDVITITGLDAEHLSNLSIYDGQGRTLEIMSLQNVNSSTTIDVSSFQPGIYFVMIQTENGEFKTEKFIKN